MFPDCPRERVLATGGHAFLGSARDSGRPAAEPANTPHQRMQLSGWTLRHNIAGFSEFFLPAVGTQFAGGNAVVTIAVLEF